MERYFIPAAYNKAMYIVTTTPVSKPWVIILVFIGYLGLLDVKSKPLEKLFRGISVNIRRGNVETCVFLPAKGKSFTTSSCPILQGRKAAKADGCSGAIKGACLFFMPSTLPWINKGKPINRK